MFKKINKKGFTLAELLIVVAIIGVLVAISIPIFTAQLKKARLATNQANARAAYAATVAGLLDGEKTAGTGVYNVNTAKCSVTSATTAQAVTTGPNQWTISTSKPSKLTTETYTQWTVTVAADGTVTYGAGTAS